MLSIDRCEAYEHKIMIRLTEMTRLHIRIYCRKYTYVRTTFVDEHVVVVRELVFLVHARVAHRRLSILAVLLPLKIDRGLDKISASKLKRTTVSRA